MPVNTLATLRARLPTRMNMLAADFAIPDIDWSLNLGIHRVQRRIDLYWDEASTTLTTSAGSRTLGGLPADYHRAYLLWIIDGTARVELKFVNRIVEIEQYPPVSNETQARPRAWYRRKDSLIVMPTPDKAYPVSIAYWAYLADLVAATDHNAVTDNYEEIVYAYAAEELSKDRGMRVEAAAWKGDRQETEKDLYFDMVEEEQGGSVVVSRGMNTSGLRYL